MRDFKRHEEKISMHKVSHACATLPRPAYGMCGKSVWEWRRCISAPPARCLLFFPLHAHCFFQLGVKSSPVSLASLYLSLKTSAFFFILFFFSLSHSITVNFTISLCFDSFFPLSLFILFYISSLQLTFLHSIFFPHHHCILFVLVTHFITYVSPSFLTLCLTC